MSKMNASSSTKVLPEVNEKDPTLFQTRQTPTNQNNRSIGAPTKRIRKLVG